MDGASLGASDGTMLKEGIAEGAALGASLGATDGAAVGANCKNTLRTVWRLSGTYTLLVVSPLKTAI
jgi:hypothetical protein